MYYPHRTGNVEKKGQDKLRPLQNLWVNTGAARYCLGKIK
jgi:hypothetical protein